MCILEDSHSPASLLHLSVHNYCHYYMVSLGIRLQVPVGTKKMQLCWHNFSLSSSLTRASGSKSLFLLLSLSWQHNQSLSAKSLPIAKNPPQCPYYSAHHTLTVPRVIGTIEDTDLSSVISHDSLVWSLILRQLVWFHSLISANLKECGQC